MNISRQVRILSLFVLLWAVLPICVVAFLIRTRAQTKTPPAQGAYKVADGPYAVETIDHTIHDAKRNKDLPARLLIPKFRGPLPASMVLHGAGGSGRNSFRRASFWAPHG